MLLDDNFTKNSIIWEYLVNLHRILNANDRVERILFKEIDGGIEILIFELNDDHYGNKK